jgi:hypothetical protein
MSSVGGALKASVSFSPHFEQFKMTIVEVA